MRTIDFTPYRRSTVGYDRLFDMLEKGSRGGDAPDGYPPFDIEHDGADGYRISLSIAGFRPEEIEIVAQQNQLTVTGNKATDKEEGSYLHRGIATRSFERRFQLADYVEVQSANFENGLLRIALKREVRETMKPRKIEIADTSPDQQAQKGIAGAA
jgi:molecular chaperone IbpA